MGIRWDPAKSAWLKRTRGVSFEEILEASLVGIEAHPKRANQQVMLFELHGYIWAVPFVSTGEGVFLKTLFPNREYTKKWLRGELG